MKEQKYHLYLSKEEYSEVLQSLIRLKSSLTAQGRCTDGVDDVLWSRQELCAKLFAGSRRMKTAEAKNRFA